MTDQATLRTTIDAAPERCFAVAVDLERYPMWARDVKQVVVLAWDEAGRPLDVEFRAAAMGRSTRYVLRYDYAEAPRRLSWRLLEGDIMGRLDGTYLFDPAAGRPDATEVTYHLVVELVTPLPAFVKRRAEARIVSTALRELKAQAEA